MVDGIFLKITDRKKEIFKLSNGKYVAPQMVEGKLNRSPYVESSLVIGSDQKVAQPLSSQRRTNPGLGCPSKDGIQDVENLYKTKIKSADS